MKIHKFSSILNLNSYCTSQPYTILLANTKVQNVFFKTTYSPSYTLECSTKCMLYMACLGTVTICSVNNLQINRALMKNNMLATHSSMEDYSLHYDNQLTFRLMSQFFSHIFMLVSSNIELLGFRGFFYCSCLYYRYDPNFINLY